MDLLTIGGMRRGPGPQAKWGLQRNGSFGGPAGRLGMGDFGFAGGAVWIIKPSTVIEYNVSFPPASGCGVNSAGMDSPAVLLDTCLRRYDKAIRRYDRVIRRYDRAYG